MKTKNLSLRIVIALVLGITAGSIFNMFEGSAFVTNIDKYFLMLLDKSS